MSSVGEKTQTPRPPSLNLTDIVNKSIVSCRALDDSRRLTSCRPVETTKKHQSKLKKCYLALKKTFGRRGGATEKVADDQFCQVSFDFSQVAEMEPSRLINYLNSQIVGRSLLIDTAFGRRLKLYCDYTASGQELRFMTDLLLKVEDYYANTHTETSATGAYMNTLLNEAELEILRTTKASPQDYFVVGAGTGSTFGIEMAQKYLGTYLPPATREQMLKAFDDGKTWEAVKNELRAKNQLPLVIVSHYEHHSNEVTWRQQLCDVIVCPPRVDGHVDLDRLKTLLRLHRPQRSRIIGSFSAGSNVTGMKTDVIAVASLLKQYNALAFFDYAAVAPYLAIDMSQKTKDGRCLIDGIYCSPHKFLGGPGSCGILIFNKNLYNNELVPSHGGGGTVDFVNRRGQVFTEKPSHREKSGTPGILQVIKAGLAFQLKSLIQPVIDDIELAKVTKFLEAASRIKNLRILGSLNPQDRVSIVSFLVYNNDGPKGTRFLHQNFVVKLLNDLFGIQGRSGCSCAGPYGHYLWNVDDEASERGRFWIEKHPLLDDPVQLQGFKVGWSRINIHYTMTDYELDYLIFAINFICENGDRFLPLYNFDPITGQWSCKNVKRNNYLPKFGLAALLKERRNYLASSSDTARQGQFEKQKNEAVRLLAKLPRSKGYDTMPEMPFCFFYAEKGRVVHRKLLKQKAAIFEKYFAKHNKNNNKTEPGDWKADEICCPKNAL